MSAFRLLSVGWLSAGLLLFFIGVLFVRRPSLEADSGSSNLASPSEFAYLNDLGDSGNPDISAGGEGSGDADVSSCDVD